MSMKNAMRDLAGFIRLKICAFISTIGINGYLLFNPLDERIIFVALASFLIAAGSYSLNNVRDIAEDKINRKGVNPYASGKGGLVIIFACFLLGFMFSLFLSFSSMLFSLIGIVTSIVYSYFKLKRYFLVKNLYTGFVISIVFLVGANRIGIDILYYYFLISFFTMILSMISDLRDYRGDKINKFKTLPVTLGYERAKKIVFFLINAFSVSILFFWSMIILLPFTLAMSYFLHKNNPISAHSVGMYSFIFFTFWLVIEGAINVYGYF